MKNNWAASSFKNESNILARLIVLMKTILTSEPLERTALYTVHTHSAQLGLSFPNN